MWFNYRGCTCIHKAEQFEEQEITEIFEGMRNDTGVIVCFEYNDTIER